MIVRHLDEVSNSERDVEGPTFRSRRFLLADDGIGFSLHDTVLHAGTVTSMWYQHHVEAVYCIEGTGWLLDHESGQQHRIEPGVLYTLDGHERHELAAETELRMVCVFTPALTGFEVHDEHGTYPAPAEAPRPEESSHADR